MLLAYSRSVGINETWIMRNNVERNHDYKKKSDIKEELILK